MYQWLVEWADALANPIAYQSALEKHAQQLAVLEEDFDAPVCQVSNNYFQTAQENVTLYVHNILQLG